ncbi:MAG: hypothetical protein LBC84_06520 [Prevotellaceae bacterium]|jgi:hypothetical protein|nr:hypothetical protein [Prevotellaceae bacterium]
MMSKRIVFLLVLTGLTLSGCRHIFRESRHDKQKISFAGGIGLKADPYIVKTAAQLAWLAELVNRSQIDPLYGGKFADKFYKLGADLDLSDYNAESNNGKGWVPIGNGYYRRFSGSFDGAGNKITGLYINDISSDYVGLFGCICGGKVQDLTIETTQAGVSGKDQVGGLAGYIDDGSSIKGCSVVGTVSGNVFVGGLAGYLRSGSMTHCYVDGKVTGTGNSVGGLIGRIEGSIVTNCFATCTVVGTGDFAGGLVGSVSTAFIEGGILPESKIENCFATGLVDGAAEDVGGLIGVVWDGSVVNCYAGGNVSGTVHVGGVVGNVSTGGKVTNCVALNNHLQGRNSVGRVTGHSYFGLHQGNRAIDGIKVTILDGIAGNNRITGQSISVTKLQQQATYVDMGWDFSTVWQIDEGNGYPTLQKFMDSEYERRQRL